jgi:hypothetical protein
MTHLSKSWLCVNCDHVGGNASLCEYCGSSALVHLQKLLDREPLTAAERTVQDLIGTAYKAK